MLYQIKNILYDDSKGIITKNNNEFKLTKTQKNLFDYFVRNPNTIISKQTIMEKVWGRIVTENSVDQIISILRNHIEDNPSNPTKLVTHFGQGISFEAQTISDGKIILTDDNQPRQKSLLIKALAFVILLFVVVVAVWYSYDKKPEVTVPTFSKNQKILVFPMTFADQSIGSIEQKGLKHLLKSAFNALDSEGQMIFDQSSLTTQQAIEKHWQRQSDLVFLQTRIAKSGNTYQGEIELTDGRNTLKKITISAESMNSLLKKHLLVISDFNQQISTENISQLINQSPDETFIQALGLKNNGDLKQAHKLIDEILTKKDDHYLARFTLAEILFEEKQYDKSLSQLNTLKATQAYKLMGTEIELALAEINFIKHKNAELIEDLKNHQSKNLQISAMKKAKIKLLMAKAYLAKADHQSAYEFYQQALMNIDPQLNPLIYAQSYLGQAKVLTHQSVGKDVYSLYEEALKSAQLAGNIHHQVLALNGMSHIAISTYNWEKSISLQKQAIELMELDNNKEQVAIGLETLVSILNLRGQFSEAKTVNDRLGNIAEELSSDKLKLHFMHFDAILAMNTFDWAHAKKQIENSLSLAEKIGDYGMQLNNAFTALELILLKKDTSNFMSEWNKREALIQQKGFERFQVYMDLYLARYYKQVERNEDAIDLLENISEKLIIGKDIKMLVDAQNQLAMVYLKSDAKIALAILNNLEQHNPHPNPYLDLKAQALFKLGKNIEALNILNQAKLVYHESWTTENQILFETIQKSMY